MHLKVSLPIQIFSSLCLITRYRGVLFSLHVNSFTSFIKTLFVRDLKREGQVFDDATHSYATSQQMRAVNIYKFGQLAARV